MTLNAGNAQVVEITTDELDHYEKARKPAPLRLALRQLDKIARDREVLIDMGETEAADGAAIELRYALLDVVAVPTSDFAAQDAKNKAVTRFFDLLDPAWLMEGMLATATKVEWQDLDLTPEQERHLRATMPASRIER